MIKLPIPPTTNHVFRARTMAQAGVTIPGWLIPKLVTMLYKSKEAKDWEKDARAQYARLKPWPKEQALDVVVGLWLPRRGTDIENRLKIMIDSFNELAWHDDSQIARLDVFRLGYDTKNPRVELTFGPYDERATVDLYYARVAEVEAALPVVAEKAKPKQKAWDFGPKPAVSR